MERRSGAARNGERNVLKLIRLFVAMLAMALAIGITTGTASAKPSIAKQAKKLCKKKRGKAKRKCVKKQTKRLKAKAKRERLKELNRPGVTVRTTQYGIPMITADSSSRPWGSINPPPAGSPASSACTPSRSR